jgi:signal transduction histidine kinase
MAVTFTVLCGLTLLMLSYFGYYFARGHFIEGTEAVIDTEIRYISAYPDALENIGPHPGRLYARFGQDGAKPRDIPANVSLMTEGIIVFDHAETGRRFAAKIYTDDEGQKTLIGVDISKMSRNYDFMMGLSLIGIFMVAAVIIGSFTISVFVVRGTNDIASTAREIMETGDLSRRITVRWRWDDLSNMADTLNMLFDRIEQLMRGVRQVSDNIAHDLRTPLTRMKASIDELVKQFPGNASVQNLSADTERMLSIFNALLRISRLESEKRRSHFQSVDLAEILKDAVEFYEPLAENKSIQITTYIHDAHVTGDRDLLFQAFANILDNAVKYTPEKGKILIKAGMEGGHAVVNVIDSGSGLPPEDLTRIFERFYRSDASRSTEGTGLGLSLTQAIIELHGGKISAENTPEGFSIITVF